MAVINAIKKENILDSWILVEHLSEGDFDPKNYTSLSSIKEKNYYGFFKNELNKRKKELLGNKRKNTDLIGLAIYFEVFEFEETIKVLREKFKLTSTHQDISYGGKKFSLALFFNHELTYDNSKLFFTASAYIRYQNDIPDSEKYALFTKNLKTKYSALFSVSTDNADDSEYAKKFNQSLNEIMVNFKSTPQNCFYKIVNNIESDEVNLHSFFIKDLEAAQKENTNNLNSYLFGKTTEGINLDSKKDSCNFNPEIFKKILYPENYPLGRFPGNPDYALSFMQQVAVNLSIGFDNNCIRSVNGPPGTGKTTLLKDIFAELIVQQAYDISQLKNRCLQGSKETTYSEGKSIGIIPDYIAEKGIVVASSNNGAVQNIVNELPLISGVGKQFLDELKNGDYFYEISNIKNSFDSENKSDNLTKESEKDKFWGLFSVEGGKKLNVNSIIEYLKSIVKYFESGNFVPNDEIYNEFKKMFEDSKKDQKIFSDRLKEYLNWSSKLTALENDLANTVGEQDVRQEVSYYQKKIDDIDSEISELNKIVQEKQVALKNYQRNSDSLSALSNSLIIQKPTPPAVPNIIDKLFNKINNNNRNSHYDAAVEQYNQDLERYKQSESKRDEIFSQILDISSEINSVIKAISDIKDNINALNKKKDTFVKDKNELISKLNQINECKLNISRFENNINFLDMSLDYNKLQLSNPWYDKEFRCKQSKLFIMALRVRKQFLYENTQNIRAAAEIWRDNNLTKCYSIAWDWINMSIPVISTTFASFYSMFKYIGCNSLGHLFVDEAGQALPQAAIGAVMRSKHVMVVGDPSQIKPVLTLDSNILAILREHFKVSEKYLSDSASVQTLVDSASQYGFYRKSDKSEDSWIGIPLWVHRRCMDPMFSISNKISYDNLMVQGKSPEDSFGKANWYDVGGTAVDKYVDKQGEFLLRLIKHMTEKNPKITDPKEKDTIYIITPFKNVAHQLAKKLKAIGFTRYDKKTSKPVNIGTIHTFQGKEAPIVFLVLGADNDSKYSAAWAVSEPNMMNVAATRAKKEFYIIGDKKLYLGLKKDVVNDTSYIIEKYRKEHPDPEGDAEVQEILKQSFQPKFYPIIENSAPKSELLLADDSKGKINFSSYTPLNSSSASKPINNTLAKICPECGRKMVIRISKSGNSPGKKFYGCSGFPYCNHTENIVNN